MGKFPPVPHCTSFLRQMRNWKSWVFSERVTRPELRHAFPTPVYSFLSLWPDLGWKILDALRPRRIFWEWKWGSCGRPFPGCSHRFWLEDRKQTIGWFRNWWLRCNWIRRWSLDDSPGKWIMMSFEILWFIFFKIQIFLKFFLKFFFS